VKEMLGENGVDVTRVGVIDEEVGRLGDRPARAHSR